MRIFICLFIVIIFSRCSRYLETKEYFEDGGISMLYYMNKDSVKHGSVTGFFPNGKLYFKGRYINNKKSDTVFYYRNSNLNTLELRNINISDSISKISFYSDKGWCSHEGLFNTILGIQIGKWKFFDSDKKVIGMKEYFNINGKQFLNQAWTFENLKDTTDGFYIKKKIEKKKIRFNDSIKCFFQIDRSYFESKNKDSLSMSVVIPRDYAIQNFNRNFSNTAKVQSKIILGEDNKIKNKHYKSNQTSLKFVSFYWKPKRIGKDTIRGYVDENFEYYPSKKENTLIQKKKRFYFEHPIEVTR